MMCSRLLSLLLPLLTMLSLLPAKWFEKNEPISIPATTHRAMMTGMKRLFLFLLLFIYMFLNILGVRAVGRVEVFHFYSCPLHKLYAIVESVFLCVYHALDACLDDEFGTLYAG